VMTRCRRRARVRCTSRMRSRLRARDTFASALSGAARPRPPTKAPMSLSAVNMSITRSPSWSTALRFGREKCSLDKEELPRARLIHRRPIRCRDSKLVVRLACGGIQAGRARSALEVRRRPYPTESSGVGAMSWIWMNLPLCVLMVAFTVGLPVWVMLKYPDDADPKAAQTAAERPREHVAGAAREAHHASTHALQSSAS
jgi:hypothetical protein